MRVQSVDWDRAAKPVRWSELHKIVDDISVVSGHLILKEQQPFVVDS